MYDGHNADENYPHETLIELSGEAIEWLNSGQDVCDACNGSGKVREHYSTDPKTIKPHYRYGICKACSGKGRGPRIAGQNFPPRIPEGHTWCFNDGNFGLYADDDLID